jgi:peroxiredoxin
MRKGATLEAGQIAPDVAFAASDGTERQLSRMVASGPVVLAFYKVTCPTCQLAIPFLGRLAGGAIPVIAVSQHDAEMTAEFENEFDVHLETVFDPEERNFPASNAFGLTHVPSIFVIGKDRKIEWSSVGFVRKDLEDLATRIGRPIFRPGDRVPEMKFG